MAGLTQDLRYAFRFLIKRPGLTGLAVLCLAIGIGANTAIFSPVDIFMLRPLPYPQAERLVVVNTVDRTRGGVELSYSLPDLLDTRAQAKTLDLAGFSGRSLNLSGREEPERLIGQIVTANFLRVLGIQPALGRDFLPGEEEPAAERPVILSHGLWQRRFDSDPRVLGQAIKLDGTLHTVVGVAPASFGFPDRNTDVWTPVVADGRAPRANHYLGTVARLTPGATVEQARAELAAIAQRLEEAYPESNRGYGAQISSVWEEIYGDGFRYGSSISSVAVFFLLLITAANVANLLLAHAASREREIAIRTALGAGRGRIARQLVFESLLLGLGGGVVGLGFAYAGIQGLKTIMPAWFPGVERMGLDARTLGFAVLVSAFAALVAGLGPAVQAVRQNVRESLQESGRGTSLGRRRGRLRGLFVVSEVALAIALLAGAGLLVKGFNRLQSAPLGFDTENVLTLRTTLPTSKYADPASQWRFTEQLTQRLAEVPGVERVGATSILPTTGNSGTYYQIEGEERPDGERLLVWFRSVSPDYFGAVGMELLRGRGFAAGDVAEAPLVTVVNEAFVRRHWPQSDALGKRLVLQSGTREIVGVVRDAQETGAEDGAPSPTVYFPGAQMPFRNVGIVLRTAGDPVTLTEPARAAVLALDPDQPVFDVMTMARRIDLDNQANGVVARIMGFLAAIALLLAVVGVYGVMSYNVSQRTQEIGIRMALGAAARDVLKMVLRQSARVMIVGSVGGVLLALGLSRGLAIFLFGVSPFDPLTYGVVVLALAASGLFAGYLPARRATRVDPLISLRTE
jgi:putative ABC transport system permease protein